MVSFLVFKQGFWEYGIYSFLSDLILVNFSVATFEVLVSQGWALATDYYDFGNVWVNTHIFFPTNCIVMESIYF